MKVGNRKRMMSEAVKDGKSVPLLSQDIPGIDGNIDDVDLEDRAHREDSYHKTPPKLQHPHGTLDRSLRKHSMEQHVAVNLGKRISIGSRKSFVENEKIKEELRRSFRGPVDQDMSREEIDQATSKSAISKCQLYFLLILMMFVNFSNFFIFDFP